MSLAARSLAPGAAEALHPDERGRESRRQVTEINAVGHFTFVKPYVPDAISRQEAGKVKTIAFPVKLSKTPANIRLAPPLLGEHTLEILKDLGYPEDEIVQLENEGAIGVYEKGN